MAESDDSLANCLQRSLPHGVTLNYYHISTAPERCPALFAPPPGGRPITTSCECQLLLISGASHSELDVGEKALFAIELYIYTTSSLTTIFVSKADSTGCIKSLNLPHGSSSIIQTITTTFLSWVVRTRHSTDKKLVLSLFARAQGAYLFPGSDENEQKHILSDRGLIKWWCKVLDPIAHEYEPCEEEGTEPPPTNLTPSPIRSKAYLKVPGLDTHETVAFFPVETKLDQIGNRRWVPSHPLYYITDYPTCSTRSIIPRFPDDPKSRFIDDLDLEITDYRVNRWHVRKHSSREGAGDWKSIETLQQFWELMAFRQECSSGRLVGFIWVLFSRIPCNLDLNKSGQRADPRIAKSKRRKRYIVASTSRRPRLLSQKMGIIKTRPLRLKGKVSEDHQTPRKNHDNLNPWEQASLVLNIIEYKRILEILLRLDFTNSAVAAQSTKKFIDETSLLAGIGGRSWARQVSGKYFATDQGTQKSNQVSKEPETKINILVPFKKRKRSAEEGLDSSEASKASKISF